MDKEVLVLLIKHQMKEMRISQFNTETVKRSIGNVAGQIGIPKEKLFEVIKPIICSMLRDLEKEIESIEFKK